MFSFLKKKRKEEPTKEWVLVLIAQEDTWVATHDHKRGEVLVHFYCYESTDGSRKIDIEVSGEFDVDAIHSKIRQKEEFLSAFGPWLRGAHHPKIPRLEEKTLSDFANLLRDGTQTGFVMLKDLQL